jgi:hypothetical protein
LTSIPTKRRKAIAKKCVVDQSQTNPLNFFFILNINKQKINNLIFLKPFSPHGLGSHGLTVVVVVVVVVLVVVKEVSQRGPLNPGRHKQILEPSNKVKQFPLIQGGGFELHLKAGDNVEVVVVLCDGGISHL